MNMKDTQWRLSLTPRKALDAAYLTAISVMSSVCVYLYHNNVGKDAKYLEKISALEAKIQGMAIAHSKEIIEVRDRATKEVMDFKDQTIAELRQKTEQQEQSRRNLRQVLDNNKQIIHKQSTILKDLKNASR